VNYCLVSNFAENIWGNGLHSQQIKLALSAKSSNLDKLSDEQACMIHYEPDVRICSIRSFVTCGCGICRARLTALGCLRLSISLEQCASILNVL
jgi:hypothetical protein